MWYCLVDKQPQVGEKVLIQTIHPKFSSEPEVGVWNGDGHFFTRNGVFSGAPEYVFWTEMPDPKMNMVYTTQDFTDDTWRTG